LEETPWHPRKFAPDVPEDFVDIIADMMEKDPSKRISSAAQVASRLEPWVSDDQEVGSVGLVRSPWMAPPPPSHDDSSDLSVDRSSILDEQQLSASTDGSVAHDTLRQIPPPPAENELFVATTNPLANLPATHRSSTAMIIALTVAIAVPPALLLGAILGFIIASR
jgi:serine/threonine protein kinase